MDHIETNNKVTLKSLDANRQPDVIVHVIDRMKEVYNMCIEYMNYEMKVLDIGTKDCLFYDVLREYGFNQENLIGVECCSEAIDICIERGYTIYGGDIQEMNNIGKYDFIFIIHTLEHVPNPELVVEKCKEMLNQNGFVFVEVPIQTQIDDPELWGHYHPFTSQQQVKDLFENGFEVVKEDWQKTKSKSPWYRVLFRKER